jgi:hypothetical protein
MGSKITEQMILECYVAFINKNRECVPKGMDRTSAKMTMSWLDCMLNTRKSYNRSGSLMQYRVILERIRQDYGSQRAKEAALSQMEYHERYNKQSHIMILERFIKRYYLARKPHRLCHLAILKKMIRSI